MARYFFHLCDGGDLLIDPDGREVDDAELIPRIALREARWCISQDVLEGRINLDQSLEVRDENENVVHHLDFRDAVNFSGDPSS